MMIFFTIVIFTATPESIWPVEYDYVMQGLELMNLGISDLEYDKHWIMDDYRLPIVSRLMDHPLQVPGYVVESGQQLKKCGKAADYIEFTYQAITNDHAKEGSIPSGDLKGMITETYSSAIALVNTAFANLASEEKDSLIYSALIPWADEADSIARYYAGAIHMESGVERDTGYTLENADLLRLAQKVDLKALHNAGIVLATGAENIMLCARTMIDTTGLKQMTIEGISGGVLACYELPGGHEAIIGGPGRNVYTREFAVIIDLGGNDIYEGRAAGAISRFGSPVSLVLDLSGDDVYRNHDRIVNQGAALLGAALLWDLDGDDTYTAFHVSQGAGLFGIGMLIDECGTDTYRAGFFSQGAGNFGSGILIERTGNEVYHSSGWTQGMGGPWAYGLLLDEDGNDTYYAGGTYLHMPLDPDQYRSFAQGFGFGWRDIASGGVGFLCDRSGNDKYISEVYAQATSYWFALGILLDEQGNDLYSAAQYSQGAGIHLSVGGLVDLEGDDHYFSRFGPSQGEGHDVAVGWLFDKDGDDVYYANGGQGIGLTNSVGIFVDTRGNDDHLSRHELSVGGANWARGTGGIGLFIDLQGTDAYTEHDKGANNHIWTSGTYALGMDLDAVAPKIEEWEDTITIFPELDTMQTDSAKIAQLFHYASLWQVRADIARVRTARRMLKEDFGPRAVEYIFHNEFITYDGLVYEAIEEIFKAFKDTAATYLMQGLRADNDTIVRNSIYFLGRLNITSAGDILTEILADRSNDTLASVLILTLGTIKDKNAVPVIATYQNHRKERIRLRVAVALGEIQDTLGVPALFNLLSDDSYLVRIAASASLCQFGTYPLARLAQELHKTKEDRRRTLLLQTINELYDKLPDTEKTPERKKYLAELVKPHISSSYPPLYKQARDMIEKVDGTNVLSPAELFMDTK
ncbi:HEAT repeat domain-containing protein [candidate division WOR-3 bacterium]|nr:HEAT repeat domain-containing protein [candidate division WOR-3 bacterium]